MVRLVETLNLFQVLAGLTTVLVKIATLPGHSGLVRPRTVRGRNKWWYQSMVEIPCFRLWVFKCFIQSKGVANNITRELHVLCLGLDILDQFLGILDLTLILCCSF